MNIDKIKRLDSPERLAEYQVDRMLELMNIKGDEIILDVGAGTGIFSIYISKQLDTGCVKAIDIDNNLLAFIDDKVKRNSISNIDTILFDGTMPVARDTADKVFICAVLHEVADKEKLLALYKECLKVGGAIYIFEFTSSRRRLNDTMDIKRKFILSSTTEKLLIECGYRDISTIAINELIYMTMGYK